MEDIFNFKIADIAKSIRNKNISAKEVCQFYLNRIESLNPTLNAILTTNEKAILEAEEIDSHLDKYKNCPLLGVPILVKDTFCTEGIRTTAGSRILENFIPPYSAEVVEKLKKAGAIILGKCNQDEFAMGNSNENSAYSSVLNPWNKEYVPGGSSGGCSAAVSAGFGSAAIGTDTGGSVRQPSSFCNLVGCKPTYGRISRYGMIAYASSLDQAGPMTVFVEDNALLLEVLSGKDKKDSTSSETEIPSWVHNLTDDISSVKVAYLDEDSYAETCSSDVLKTVQQTVNLLKSKGASVQEISLPFMDVLAPVYYLISTSEASSNLARYDGIRYGHRTLNNVKMKLEDFYSRYRSEKFGSEVKRRILMGTYCLSKGYYDEYYNKACQIRRMIRDQVKKLFSQFSVLIMPVSSIPAFRLKENVAGSVEYYLSDNLTVLSNLCGLPSLSVPAGFSSNELPIGVQLIGDHFNEQDILNVALCIQNETKMAGRRPCV